MSVGDNAPPHTYVALFPFADSLGDTLAYTTSRQQLHWWGDDPDGFVIGFFISRDSLAWVWTERTDSLLIYRFSGQDTIAGFFVQAVDDGGNGRYDETSWYGPEPFTDLDGNGRWDPGESYVDLGEIDHTPARLRLPMRNTAPTVDFLTNTEVPETTFTVATFSWTGKDLDGDETIEQYFWTIDDTSNQVMWKSVPRSTTLLTLFEADGLTEGNHVFYLRAQDQAGSVSPWIRMPDTNNVWYVKRPRSDLLVVDDYTPASDDPTAFYRAQFDTLAGGRYRNFDVWDVKTGRTSTTRGRFVPAYVDPTVVETLKLFRYILWYTDNTPSMDIMSVGLLKFRVAGGKILLSLTLPTGTIDPTSILTDFAPVDSVGANPLGGNGFIPANTLLSPDTLAFGFPPLVRDASGIPVAFVRSFVPKTPGGTALYRLPISGAWPGRPIVGVRSTMNDFILLGLPLHRLNGGTAPAVGVFLRRTFIDEFGG